MGDYESFIAEKRKVKVLKRKNSVWVLFIALLMIAMIPLRTVSASSPALSVVPLIHDPSLGLGMTFTVDVAVSDAADLYGYEFKMSYNTELLDCVSLALPSGHFLEPVDPTKLFVAKLECDEANGIVWAAVSLLSPEDPKEGSGTLVTITFEIMDNPGSSFFGLYDTKLSDVDSLPIDHDVVDGYFVNTDVAVLPPFIPLMGSEFTIDIGIIVEDLYGWEFKLEFDADVLDVVSYAIVPFLNPPTWPVDNSDPEAGLIWLAESSLLPADPKSGEGILATITFSTKVPLKGSRLILTTKLSDLDVTPIPHTTESGSYGPYAVPPVAYFEVYASTIYYVGDSLTFDASGSYDADGTIVDYYWDFDDGTFGSGEIVTHAYSAEKIYKVYLKVTDNDGFYGNKTVVLPVEYLVEADISIFGIEKHTWSLSKDDDGYLTLTAAVKNWEPSTVRVMVVWKIVNIDGTLVFNYHSIHESIPPTKTIQVSKDVPTTRISSHGVPLGKYQVTAYLRYYSPLTGELRGEGLHKKTVSFRIVP